MLIPVLPSFIEEMGVGVGLVGIGVSGTGTAAGSAGRGGRGRDKVGAGTLPPAGSLAVNGFDVAA